MKIKEGFEKRTICGMNVIVAVGMNNVNFSRMLVLNDSSSYLWDNLLGKEFTPESMAGLLVGQYDVDEETALKDSKALCEKWAELGLIG